jgi:8-oxo-dGTP pyrophosphatase MutT (NUDIX family)
VTEFIVPRDAATVVVVRNASPGVELFCVERHARSGFMGGALVFPGGKVDAGDADDIWRTRATPLSQRARSFADTEREARSFAVAAAREALEEAAICPVLGDRLDTRDALALREELKTSGGLARSLADRALTLDIGRLEALGRWVTPVGEKKRFDTRFYLLLAPHNQAGAHDDHETTRSLWATPAELLLRWEKGDVHLVPPTAFTIGLFLDSRNADDAVAVANDQSLSPILPCFVQDGGQMVITLPGDPLHPGGGGISTRKGAPTRFVREGQRFVPVRVG